MNQNMKSSSSLTNITFNTIKQMNEISKFIYNDKDENPNQNVMLIPPVENKAQIPLEYINEIWIGLIERESANNYNYDSIVSIQKDINSRMRAILVDWLISVHSQFHLKQPTLFLTVNIIDRYISNKEILRSRFQLLGITSLFIACKYEEICFPHISYFVEFTAKTYTKTEILEMESDILNTLTFELNLPSSINFFEILSLIYEFNKEEYKFGSFLLELYLLDVACNKYLQSHVALSVSYILLKKRKDELWFSDVNNTNMKFIRDNIDIIKKCVQEIKRNLDNNIKIKYTAVFEKYSM